MRYPPIPFKIRTPAGFTWEHPLRNLKRMPNGKFKTSFDVSDYEFSGFDYYVNVNTGNDTNDGLTPETPFKSIAAAINKHGGTPPGPQSGGVVVRSTDWTDEGYSWKVTTPGNVANEGMRATPDPRTIVGRSYTVRAKIKAVEGGTIGVVFAARATSATFTAGEVKTLEKTYTATATAHGTHVRTITTAQAINFYVKDFELIDNVTGQNILKTYQSTAEPLLINVAEGFYNRNNGFNNTSLLVDTVIKGRNVIISAENTLTYSLSAGQTHTYEASETSQVFRVFDSKNPDSNGDYVEYTKKTSIAEAEATPGSWYWASNVLYVHTIDNRTPDSDIHSYIAAKQVDATGKNVYLEGLKIYGGGSSLSTSNGLINHTSTNPVYNLYMKDCKVKYSINDNKGIFISKSHAYIQNVESAKNNSDGFNYHNAAKAIEIDCVGRDNGYSGANDNGSSIHEASAIIRINGEYMRNYGPNVIDINEGSQSWNLGCKAYESKATLSTNNSDFHNQQAEMWLDSCKSHSSQYGVGCDNIPPLGTTYLRMVKESVQRVIGGNIENY